MQKDCYTCRWAVRTAQGVVCTNIWLGFPIKSLLLFAPFPCCGWEREQGKLVNERERTI